MAILQRWIWVTAPVIAVGLFPQQGQATPSKSNPPTPTKSEQVTSPKSGQPTAAKQEASFPKLSLREDSTTRIPIGSRNGVVQIMMNAENLTETILAEAKEPLIKDLGGVGPVLSTAVTFEKSVAVDVGTTSRGWMWTTRISNLPANSSQMRCARLSHLGRWQD